MSIIKSLFDNKWVSIVEKTMDDGSKYVYSTSVWCGSEGVSILPYRKVAGGFEFLGRFEVCPAHSDKTELCSITGGMDKEGESPVFTAMRELIEEGGYKVPIENIVLLGTVRPSKSSDSTTHLFAVNVDAGHEVVTATGDGTLGEEGAYCAWVSLQDVIAAKDPLLHANAIRLIAQVL